MPSNAFFDFFDIPELEGPESLLVVEFELISSLSSSLGDLLLPRTNALMRSRKRERHPRQRRKARLVQPATGHARPFFLDARRREEKENDRDAL